uniref:Uncharacterized protein n=1 Tax=Rhodomela confervoides TaxID=35163 RepID=A0A1Z1M9K2_RHOCN|nr:hypothetical protein [Rhodomela confervoides]ARW62650.1 hypothetical protein [Rhodomela confervoides]
MLHIYIRYHLYYVSILIHQLVKKTQLKHNCSFNRI